jgi:hypothetical protein
VSSEKNVYMKSSLNNVVRASFGVGFACVRTFHGNLSHVMQISMEVTGIERMA